MRLSQQLEETIRTIRDIQKSLADGSASDRLQTAVHDLSRLQNDIHILEHCQQATHVYPELFDLVSADKSATYQRILEWVSRLFSAEFGYLLEPDTSERWYISYRYPHDHAGDIHQTFITIFATHTDILLTNTAVPPDDAQQLVIKHLHEVFIVPLIVDDKQIAGLYLGQRINSNHWREQDLAQMRQVAPMIAHALTLAGRLDSN